MTVELQEARQRVGNRAVSARPKYKVIGTSAREARRFFHRGTLTDCTSFHTRPTNRIAFLLSAPYVDVPSIVRSLLFSHVPRMDYWLAFLAGLFGSMHCVGMCGPIVLAYSTQGSSEQSSPLSHLTAHLSYNSGRVLSYTLVGAFLGLLGGNVTGLHEIGYWFSLLLGILLVLAGVSLLRLLPRFSVAAQINVEQQTRNLLFRLYRKIFGVLIGQRNLESKFYIGLMTPLLPCGLLYAMFLKAIGAGSFLNGALTMFLFGVGIVPALVVTGIASSYFGQKLRVWGDKIAAVTILLMGLSLIWRALNVEAMFHFH